MRKKIFVLKELKKLLIEYKINIQLSELVENKFPIIGSQKQKIKTLFN